MLSSHLTITIPDDFVEHERRFVEKHELTAGFQFEFLHFSYLF